jgi:Spy/CpxP family protein refolding chaperone
MTLTRHRLAAVLAAFVLAIAAHPAAQAAPGGHRHGEAGMMMGRGMERMLDAVKASEEQRAQIRQITGAARADMQAERDASQALREQMHQLFIQPTVDANVAEALRRQMLAQHDRRSQRMMQAMIEISRVLSPEQRQQIGELMKQHGGHRHRDGHRPG